MAIRNGSSAGTDPCARSVNICPPTASPSRGDRRRPGHLSTRTPARAPRSRLWIERRLSVSSRSSFSSSRRRPRTSSSCVAMCPSDWSRIRSRASGSSACAYSRRSSARAISASSSCRELLEREPEQVAQPNDLVYPLDVGLRCSSGACPASRSRRPEAGRSPRSSGSCAAWCRSARRPRRSAAARGSTALIAAWQLLDCRRSGRVHRARGVLTCFGRAAATNAPSTETAARHQSAVCMLAMNGSSWALEMWFASPEKTLNRTCFGTDEVTTASTKAIEITAPVFCTSTRAPAAIPRRLAGHRAHHRRRVGRVEHARARCRR